ncbi:MAG: hypothetical protein V4454_17140 [Pseudomonadota bacterium]
MLEVITRAEAYVEAELQWNDPEISKDRLRSLFTTECLQALKLLRITVQCVGRSADSPIDQAAMDEATLNHRALQDVKKLIELCQKFNSDVDKHFPEFLASAPELDTSLDRFHIELTLRSLTPEHLDLVTERITHLQKLRKAGVLSMAIDARCMPQAEENLSFCLFHQAAEYVVTIVKVPPNGEPAGSLSSQNHDGPPSLAPSASNASKRTNTGPEPYAPINFEDVDADLTAGRTVRDCFHKYCTENSAARTYGKSSFFNKISDWQKSKSSDDQTNQAP